MRGRWYNEQGYTHHIPMHLHNDTSQVAVGSIRFPDVSNAVNMEKWINRFAGAMQFLTWFVLYPLFNVVFSLKVYGRDNINRLDGPFIIISNHISFYDSFLFRVILGPFTRHLPLRFVGVRNFEWPVLNMLRAVGIIDLIYRLFGVIVVVPGRGLASNLSRVIEVIHAGGNVVIYPEGRINQSHGVGQFKKGAAALATQTGVPVIPIAFRLGRRKFLRRELTVVIGVGEHVVAGTSFEEITATLHSKVEELYNGVDM